MAWAGGSSAGRSRGVLDRRCDEGPLRAAQVVIEAGRVVQAETVSDRYGPTAALAARGGDDFQVASGGSGRSEARGFVGAPVGRWGFVLCQDDAESKQRLGGNAGRDQRLDLRFELAGFGSVVGGDGEIQGSPQLPEIRPGISQTEAQGVAVLLQEAEKC